MIAKIFSVSHCISMNIIYGMVIAYYKGKPFTGRTEKKMKNLILGGAVILAGFAGTTAAAVVKWDTEKFSSSTSTGSYQCAKHDN